MPFVHFGEGSNVSKPKISCAPASSLRALEPVFVAQSLSTEPVKRSAYIKAGMKLSILMPAYNEEGTITHLESRPGADGHAGEGISGPDARRMRHITALSES